MHSAPGQAHAAAACDTHTRLLRLQVLSTYLAHLLLQGRSAIATARITGWPFMFTVSLPAMAFKGHFLAGCWQRKGSCLASHAVRTVGRR